MSGHGGSGTEKLTYLSLQLLCQGTAQGTVTGVGVSTLTDSAASGDWTDDQFNGANGSFFVELTNGPAVGVSSNITDTSNTGQLTLLDDLSALTNPPVAGNAIVIRPHVTYAKLLPDGGGLQTNADSNLADNILVVDPSSGTVSTFYHDGTNWRQAGVGIADNTPIMPEQGFVVRRRQNGDVVLAISGVAKAGVTVVPIEQGFNLVGTLKAATAVSLDDLDLFPGVDSGDNPTAADNVLIIEANGAVSRYFYVEGQAGNGLTDGWYDVGYNTAGSVMIQPGSSFYLLRRSGAFNWTIPPE